MPTAAAAILALCVGIAVPAAVFGKAVMGVVLAPAVVVVLLALTRSELRRSVLLAVRSPEGLAFGLFGIAALISVTSSEHVFKSLETWGRTVAFVLFGLTATFVLARDRNALNLTKRALVVGGVVALSYVVVAVHLSDAVLAPIALGSEIRHPVALNFKGFASAVVCLLPAALWGSAGPGSYRKVLRLCLLVLAVLSIWLDGYDVSLSAILGVAAALILLGAVRYIGRLPRRTRILASVGLLIAGMMAATAVTAALPEIDRKDQDRLAVATWLIDEHRQFIWAFTVAATRENPAFGLGPNTINLIEGADQRVPNNRGSFVPSHPHNWIYEIASETGLVGLFALCLALVLLLRRIAVLALNGSRAGWAAVALFGAFWGSSLVNFSIWAAWWQLTFITLLTILMAAARPTPHRLQKTAASGE